MPAFFSSIRLPELSGQPVEIRYRPDLRDRRGPVHGGAFLPQRLILLDAALRGQPQERRRIVVHELFHFVWVRLNNGQRWSYEQLIREEGCRQTELGWSSESRRSTIAAADVATRTRRWREYVCESFCDTAAWLYAGLPHHPEFTLPAHLRARRRQWFENLATNGVRL